MRIDTKEIFPKLIIEATSAIDALSDKITNQETPSAHRLLDGRSEERRFILEPYRLVLTYGAFPVATNSDLDECLADYSDAWRDFFDRINKYLDEETLDLARNIQEDIDKAFLSIIKRNKSATSLDSLLFEKLCKSLDDIAKILSTSLKTLRPATVSDLTPLQIQLAKIESIIERKKSSGSFNLIEWGHSSYYRQLLKDCDRNSGLIAYKNGPLFWLSPKNNSQWDVITKILESANDSGYGYPGMESSEWQKNFSTNKGAKLPKEYVGFMPLLAKDLLAHMTSNHDGWFRLE